MARCWASAASSGHSGEVSSISWNNDGTKLASGSHDKTVKIWSKGAVGPFQCQSTLNVDSGCLGVQLVSFSPSGDVVAAGCHNGKIYFVDAAAGQIKSSAKGHRCVLSVCLSVPDFFI